MLTAILHTLVLVAPVSIEVTPPPPPVPSMPSEARGDDLVLRALRLEKKLAELWLRELEFRHPTTDASGKAIELSPDARARLDEARRHVEVLAERIAAETNAQPAESMEPFATRLGALRNEHDELLLGRRLQMLEQAVDEVIGNARAGAPLRPGGAQDGAVAREVKEADREARREEYAALRREARKLNQQIEDKKDTFVPKRTPAFNWDLIAGAQLSQSDDRFSEVSEYVSFTASERLGSPDRDGEDFALSFNRLYPFFNVALQALPTRKVDAMNEFFADSEKTASLVVGIDYRFADWESAKDGPNRGYVALHLNQGLHAFLGDEPGDAANNVDEVNSSYGIGLQIGEYLTKEGDRNPSLYRYATATYGDYGQFGNGVWTIEGLLRFAERADRGFFLGVRAILGQDDDREDFAIFAGFNDVLGLLAPLFEEIGSLVGED